MIDNLKQLPPEKVERFLKMRTADGTEEIPAPLAKYILQIDRAFELNRKYSSISECARQLQKIYPELSLSTCKNRIYDAINYFYQEEMTVTADKWNLIFADQMMQLRDVNLAAHDLREARICMERAREYRIAASQTAVNPELIKFKEQLISPDIKKERFGIGSSSIIADYRKALKIIEDRDIPAGEKERLKSELEQALNMEEIEYEDSQN
jgi:hypothetical protein